MTKITHVLLLGAALAFPACSGDDERDPGEVKSGGTPNNVTTQTNGSTSSNNIASNVATADMGREDTGTPNNQTPDMGMMPEDMGMVVDPPTGETCPYTDLRQYAGNCDAVRATGCPATEECIPGISVAGTDTNFSAFCREPDMHELLEGETCESSGPHCSPGLACISFYSECRRVCYPDTALGCLPGEFCRRPAVTWEGLGFCDNTCNL